MEIVVGLTGEVSTLVEREDTAREVRALRQKNVRVAAVFTGEDRSAGDAEEIYGRSLARIRTMDQLAGAAGALIRREIQELSD